VTAECDASQPTHHTFDPKPSRKRSEAPPDDWQRRALQFVTVCADLLSEDTAAARSTRKYLRGRGFSEDLLDVAGIGMNPKTQRDEPGLWGRDDDRDVWIPRGVVIPWFHGGHLWGVNIRRPNGDVDDGPKYHRIRGTTNALFGADEIDGRPVVLVEGELDALAVRQETDEATAVATGSTSWARAPRWKALLRTAPTVLVAFDAEDAGEEAARYWTTELPNAVRWRPTMHDTAEMLQEGANIARWVEDGLDYAAGVPRQG
jgi:DNA primase